MIKEFNWLIAGHKNIINFLQSSIRNNRLSHAYVFSGDEHLGKKTVADYFVKSILCNEFNKSEIVPCGKCLHCKQFDSNTHPDLITVKRIFDKKEDKIKKNISIEQIRDLRDKISLGSFLKNYKIIVIEDAETLSLGASDALLKTLEEPSKKTIFILLTSREKLLSATILSRCQKINFLPLSFSDIYDYIVLEKKINRNIALDLVTLSQGKPGLVEYFLQDDNLKRYYNDLENNLNLTTKPYYQRFIFANDILATEKTLNNQKKIVLKFLTQWETILRDWLLIEKNGKSILNKFIDNLKNKNYKNKDLILLLDYIKEARTYLNSNVNPKLILENFLLKL